MTRKLSAAKNPPSSCPNPDEANNLEYRRCAITHPLAVVPPAVAVDPDGGPGIVVVASFYSGWLAVTTDDGVVVDDYYKRGLSINKRLERVDRAAMLHLGAIVDVAPDGDVRVALESSSMDPQAMPAVVRVFITHPTRPGQDRIVEVVRGADGRYAGRTAPVSPGRWLVALETEAWRLAGRRSNGEPGGDLRNVRLGHASNRSAL